MTSQQGGGLQPILCAHLLRKVDEKLIELLSSLAPEDWNQQTVAGRWTVRDVAAHLLDTALRKLSIARDTCFVEPVEIRSPQDIVTFVNRLNQEGVTVYRRFSPLVLIDMMRVACGQNADFHESLDPFAPASLGVSWAGEEASLNWFDTARELTERWHHQQQIRVATDRAGILTPELYHPVLDCFLHGLPHLFREVEEAAGTTVVVAISGDCGGRWFLVRRSTGWVLETAAENIATEVTIPQEIAWRVFTKGIAQNAAREQIQIAGNQFFGDRVLRLTAIVA